MEFDHIHGKNLWHKAALVELHSIDEYGAYRDMDIGLNHKYTRRFAITLSPSQGHISF